CERDVERDHVRLGQRRVQVVAPPDRVDSHAEPRRGDPLDLSADPARPDDEQPLSLELHPQQEARAPAPEPALADDPVALVAPPRYGEDERERVLGDGLRQYIRRVAYIDTTS